MTVITKHMIYAYIVNKLFCIPKTKRQTNRKTINSFTIALGILYFH